MKRTIAFFCAVAIVALALSLYQPASAQRAGRGQPCAGDTVYVLVQGANGLIFSRPLIVSMVEEGQTVTGYVFPVEGDLVPANWFDFSADDTEPSDELLEFSPVFGPLYLERLKFVGNSNRLIGNWRHRGDEECYSGDPTPFSGR